MSAHDEALARLGRAWAVLVPPSSTELSSYPILDLDTAAPCRVALDQQNLRHLLVPVEGETVTADARPSVLASLVRSLRFDHASAVYVDIWCADPDLNEEFEEVLGDILTTLQASDRPAAAALDCLARWRRLFRNRLLRGLTGHARAGLFAELTVFDALLTRRPDLPVTTWTGPLGTPHDFEAPRLCLEVKAAGAGTEPVTIHGIDQLDTHDERSLELLVLTIAADTNGTTLTDLVGAVRDKVCHVDELERRLYAAGWRSEAGVPDTDAMTIAGMLRVPITPAVPRLTRADLAAGNLRPGVRGVNYQIEGAVLAACAVSGSLDDVVRKALA